jgi:hypothetical protein
MSELSVATIEQLIAGFPCQPEKIQGMPTYETLRALKSDLKSNASSVDCSLGGALHGYLGALISPAAYGTIAGQNYPFIKPVFPGYQATVIPTDTTAVRDATLRTYKTNFHAWREHDHVIKALRKQLISAIEEPFIRHLKDPNTAYNSIALETMLAYLFAEYGDIDDNALAENEKRLVEPWDGVEQLENIFTRMHECIDFAEAAEQPYTDKQILSKALALIFNTGLYADDIKEWNRMPINQKNLATFKTHFLKAQKTLRKQRATV